MIRGAVGDLSRDCEGAETIDCSPDGLRSMNDCGATDGSNERTTGHGCHADDAGIETNGLAVRVGAGAARRWQAPGFGATDGRGGPGRVDQGPDPPSVAERIL